MATDYDAIRRVVRSSERAPPEWPSGVAPISIDGLSLLGVGPDNTIYWDGRQIEIARTVSLNWWQTTLATMTAVGTLAAGIATVLPYFGIRP